MRLPLAYLLTFRTYGTWLHGNERGWVDRKHNTVGSPIPTYHAGRWLDDSRRLQQQPTILKIEQRRVIEQAIRMHCEFRGWQCHVSAVQTTHVHVVASADIDPMQVIGQLKSRSTRVLREQGLLDATRKLWAEGGSRRYLWTNKQLNAVISYVSEGQNLPR